jgi:RNA polymerase sigma-70 factor (ECF subfamily)
MDTVTSQTLLEGLKNPQDSHAWQRFCARYGPMILAFAKKLGLKDADAQDVSQEAMLAFVQGYWQGRYDPRKGRLRSWLFGITHRKLIDMQRQGGREVVIADNTDAEGFLGRIPSPDQAEHVWEQEWQRAVLRACLDEVSRQLSPTTVSAFELYALKGWPPDKVADHLGITKNAVYIAKNQTMNHIKKIKAEMEQIW